MALGNIITNKVSRGDELFQILKDGSIKVLYSTCQQIGKTHQWPQDWKRSIFISIPKKGICWIIEKARGFQKNIYFCFIDYTKAFDYVDHNKTWNLLVTCVPHMAKDFILQRERDT